MDRVLKFRAWHIADKQMLNEGYNGEVFITTGQLFGYGESVKLMQFTGLKDCKGVEIYEGDIWLSTADSKVNIGTGERRFVESWVKGTIDFVSGAFITTYRLQQNSFFGTLPHYQSPFVRGGVAEHIEIIGNIHQNPELIEG